MRRLLLSLLVLAFAIPVFAQAKHPFTFDDMMKLKRVGDPQVSPDGKWVIFSVVDVDLTANSKTPHIWIVPTAGGGEKAIIADQDADRPRWAPDGKRFAFLSTKDGGSQVWIAEFDGGAGKINGVRRFTSIATEAGGELWSPDGKNILFTSDVYPECDGQPQPEADCNAKRLKEAEQSKVKAQLFTHLLYRHWNAYKEGKRSHIFVVAVDACVGTAAPGCPAGAARDLTPGDYDAPVFSLGGQDDYAFSPDGQEICYVSNHDKNPAASTNNDLWIVPVNAGTDRLGAGDSPAQVLAQTRNITADNPASDTSPLYSPDGRYIAYRTQQRPGYESDRFRLMLYARKTGEKKNLTEDFDRWVGTMAWSPDSTSIFFSAENAGNSAIFNRLIKDIPGVANWPVETVRGFDDDINTVSGTKTIVFTRMSLGSPTGIYVASPNQDGKLCVEDNFSPKGSPSWYEEPKCVLFKAKQLTHLNDDLLSQVSMSPLESFWFTGAHSDKVQGFLVKPPNFDASKKYPVKFLIHGGPQGAWGDDWSYRWNPELFAANGYVVIMINFHGSTGYGQKFIDAINGDWGGAPFEDLMKGLDYAEQTYPFIDKNRECALGASYGGYMASTGSSATPTASSASCRTTACSMPSQPGARRKNSGSTTGSSKVLPTTIAKAT